MQRCKVNAKAQRKDKSHGGNRTQIVMIDMIYH